MEDPPALSGNTAGRTDWTEDDDMNVKTCVRAGVSLIIDPTG